MVMLYSAPFLSPLKPISSRFPLTFGVGRLGGRTPCSSNREILVSFWLMGQLKAT